MPDAGLYVFDLHSDMLVDVLRRRDAGETKVIVRRHLPGLRKGCIGAVSLAVWVEPAFRRRGFVHVARLLNAFAAEMNESAGEIQQCTTMREVRSAVQAGRLAVVLSVEGLGSVSTSAEMLNLLHHFGVRIASLTWNEKNVLAGGVASPGATGLTPLGKESIRKMVDLGIILDVSHLNVHSFWDVLEASTRPVIASHSNARALCDVPRNLTDDQMKAVARTGGVIGINAWPSFIDASRPSMERYLDHVEYVADLVGIDHVALGFDFCDYIDEGTLQSIEGNGQTTEGLEKASLVHNLLDRMAKRGFSAADIEKVSNRNAGRLLDSIEVSA
ncbi:MAG: dipeptidase [Ignavibacteriales bacterium]